MSEENNKKVENGTEEPTGKEKEKEPTMKEEKKETGKKEKKESVIKRFGKWCKTHKEALITGGVAFGAGFGSAVGAGIVMNKRAERKSRERNAYIADNEEVNPLDPNM